jgi:ankyrin repeat protein
VVTLLLQYGASPHARSNSESTPFYRAARNGSVRTLRLLWEAGSELDSKTWDSWTPLMEAVENEQQQAVVKLAGVTCRPGTSGPGCSPGLC